MNIFILDKDYKKAAQYHVDRHIVKMPLETAQLLCTAHWETGSEAPYRSTHRNHPCSKWVRESLANYDWLCGFGIELCREYTYRYGKRHKTQDIIEWCIQNKPRIENVGLTSFALAMPDYCKGDDAVAAYRTYYNKEKTKLFSWKKRNRPDWIKEEENDKENKNKN